MSWDDYKQVVRDEWASLLASAEAGEPEVHSFLEQHPCLLPGYDAFEGAHPGNSFNAPGPVYECAFSKPILPGIQRQIPDFMWLPTDSQNQWAVLIEIEDPKKPWLTSSGQPSSKLTQAVDQVMRWRQHLENPSNRQQLLDLYGIPNLRPLRFAYCLIYGRRSEVDARAWERAVTRRDDLRWMTFDRLRPNESARDCISARIKGGSIEAITVPPTLRLTPNLSRMWRNVKGKAEAAMLSPHFEGTRQTFLAERFRYWDRRINEGPLHPFPLNREFE